MVGAERFELPTPWSQTRCASQTALRPDRIIKMRKIKRFDKFKLILIINKSSTIN